MKFSEQQVPIYARVLIDACYFAERKKIPNTYVDNIERTVSFIHGVTGYQDTKVIKRWLTKGDIDRNDGKGLSKNNYEALMRAWVSGECPMFQTKADIRYFSKYGREIFRRWSSSLGFDEFCVENNLEDGPLASYWNERKLTRSVIWDALNLPAEIIKDLEDQSDVVQRTLTKLLNTIARSEKRDAVKVFWVLAFNIGAIEMATHSVESRMYTWNDLYDLLNDLPPLAKLPKEKLGVLKILKVIRKSLSKSEDNYLLMLGYPKYLKFYETLHLDILWNFKNIRKTEALLQKFATFGIVKPLEQGRWVIPKLVWIFLQREYFSLNWRLSYKTMRWELRCLNTKMIAQPFRRGLRTKKARPAELLDFKTFSTRRTELGVFDIKDRSFFRRFGKMMLGPLTEDSDIETLMKFSENLSSNDYLYMYFLHNEYRGVVVQAVGLAIITKLLIDSLLLSWAVGIVLIIPYALLKYIAIEKSWISFWEDYLNASS